MCSELTPRAHIPDTRIQQLMQPWFSIFIFLTVFFIKNQSSGLWTKAFTTQVVWCGKSKFITVSEVVFVCFEPMLFCCVQNSLYIPPFGIQYALQQDLYHNHILEIIWSGVEVKALCPSWADTEIVSGVGDGMEDGAERKVAISSIVNVTIIIFNI